ncbi:MAG TPA: META domain-containing protein [Longimicrobium sp.]|nr:META domain-containing protein [Longimicrobium sp.]
MALALAGCPRTQTAGAGSAAPSLAGTQWRLDELNGRPPIQVPGGGVPTLAFAANEPRANGNGGCNLFNGQYTQSGESLRLGPLASTRRACLSDEATAQETAFLRALDSTTRFSVSGDVLVLYAGEQTVARLRRSGG